MSAPATPCELRSYPDHVTVVVHPEAVESAWSDVDAFGENVKQELERRSEPACIVDLSPLNYMGSSMVALIVRVWKIVQSRRGKMVVVAANPVVLDVIRLAGLDRVWRIAPELKEGEKQLGVSSASHSIEILPVNLRSKPQMMSFVLGIVTVLIALMATLLILANR